MSQSGNTFTTLTTTSTIGIAFREWLGGEKAIHEYCHQLAMDGAKRLAEIMGTRVLDETGELTVHMVSCVPSTVPRLSSIHHTLCFV